MKKKLETKEPLEGREIKKLKKIIESSDIQRIDEKTERIKTFDDIARQPSDRRINTFDDLVEHGSYKPIRTFDDLIEPKGLETSKPLGEGVEKPLKDSHELAERERIKQAAEKIKQIEAMRPEKWKNLSKEEKEWSLRRCGKALRDVYHTPDPPLLSYKGEINEHGEYGDGSSYRKTAIFNRDYGIRMNEEGMKETGEKLFGDDPKAALETYAHEFRHSYQCEQAHAFDQGLKTDNPVKAKEWSENLGKNYIEPPSSELADTNPQEYKIKFGAYENQPVERDARDFASKLVSEIYDTNE